MFPAYFGKIKKSSACSTHPTNPVRQESPPRSGRYCNQKFVGLGGCLLTI
jgi:hypothetical protein